MAKLPRTPDLNAQRAAMQKLAFLDGKWNGDATLLHSAGQPVELHQTEEVNYKLDGLVLTIEGIGRKKSDGQELIQAFAIISFDDESAAYRMRAFNGGRFLESEVELLEEGRALGWGFSLGDITTKSLLRIDERGDWTELAEIRIGAEPARKLLDLTVRRITS
jgi:hypothetical protein